jgi:hypothetical protein
VSDVPAVNLEGAVPTHLPVLPLKSTVVFPRIFIPLSVGRKKSLQLLDDLSGAERHIAVATQLDETAEEVGFKDVHHVGTMVRVQHLLKLPDGTVQLAVNPPDPGGFRGAVPDLRGRDAARDFGRHRHDRAGGADAARDLIVPAAGHACAASAGRACGRGRGNR